MLKELEIRDFALVEHVRLPFSQGFNALTGETGAGKSIIMDALNVVLGGRSGPAVIRPGAERATIEATFGVSTEVSAWLKERELLDQSSDEFNICREITKSGTKIRVNGTLVSSALVSELAVKLVTVHAQHESRTLLSSQSQLEMLDALGDDEQKKLLAKVRTLYAKKRDLDLQLADLLSSEQDRERRLDFARFQLAELEQAQLEAVDEDEEVAAERRIAASAEQLKSCVSSIQTYLRGGHDDSIPGAAELLDRALEELSRAAEIDQSLDSLRATLEECATKIEEESRVLRKYSDSLECDPERLAMLEDRHAQLAAIKRKYGPALADAIARRDELSGQISSLENSESEIRDLQDELADLQAELTSTATALSKKRKTLSGKLSSRIEKELADLGMEKCRFEIAFTQESSIGPSGLDKVDFLIAPNPGQPAGPVSKIASGGELSRVMLAVKSIFAAADRVSTVIFDEIDSGLSGKVLQSMRDKLAVLAHSHQILCITHQPIIASVADSHVLISKKHTDSSTSTQAQVLTAKEERVKALASMASGQPTQSEALGFARALFDESQRAKGSL